jgi:hypothetical protein
MIDYFVIGHNPKLYADKPNFAYRFLQVGMGANDNSKAIVCHKLHNNIEQYPNLCSFTGWYAIANNNLCDQDSVCLLEYDTIAHPNIHANNIKLLTENKSNTIIAYSNTLTNHYVFTKSTPWLELSLKKIHNIDLDRFVHEYGPKFPLWPTTTNMTLSMGILKHFVDWFKPMTDLFKYDPLGAYVHERAFFVFCVLHNLNIIFALNLVQHKQKRSHNINDIYGSFLKSKNTNYLSDHMKYEYDILYNNTLRHIIRLS